MHNEFTTIIERDDDWFIAYCPEIPGANGEGCTSEEARASLGGGIALIVEDRREDALRGVPVSLFVPQCLDRIQLRRLRGRVDPEDDAEDGAEAEGEDDGP